MSRRVVLTDLVLRDALLPPASLRDRSSLLDAIASDVRRTPQRRRRPWSRIADAFVLRPIAERRLVLIVALVGLLLALAAVSLAGARLLQMLREDPVVVIENTTPESTGVTAIVIDGKGVGWAAGPGYVTRFDPVTGERTTFTSADGQPVGTSSSYGAARSGGVWMVRSDPVGKNARIGRFDGVWHAEEMPLPSSGSTGWPEAVVEASDGTLWIASSAGGVSRWTGSSWAPELPGITDAEVVYGSESDLAPATLVARGNGEIWASLGSAIHRLTPAGWLTYDATNTPALAGWPAAGDPAGIVDGEDGAIWLAGGTHLVRWGGSWWERLARPDIRIASAAVDALGDIWAISDGGRLGRRHEGTWTFPGPESGLGSAYPAVVSAAGGTAWLGTDRGIFRLSSKGVAPLWGDPQGGPGGTAASVLAVSRDEAWVGGDGAVWHYLDGGWQRPERPLGLGAGQFVRGLALSPDGRRLAAATDAGVAVREEDGRWTWAYSVDMSTGAPTAAVAFEADGSIWTAQTGWPTRILVHLTEVDGDWTAQRIDCPSGGWFVVVARDGSVWTGGIAYSGAAGLSRYDGQRCVALQPPQVGADFETGAIAADPDGGVVLGVHDQYIGGDGPRATEYTLWTDGTTWQELRAEKNAAVTLSTVAVDPRGDPVIGSVSVSAVLRMHAGIWTPLESVPLAWSLSFAPDGTLWTFSSEGVYRIRGIRPAE